MAKLTLDDVGNLNTAGLSTINENSSRIETAFENTLSRDGTTPNQMEADLDLNHNDILNVDNLDVDGEFVLQGQTVHPDTLVVTDAVLVTDDDASGFDFVVDEDDMSSDLDTKVPTQQSVKAYVDNSVADLDTLKVPVLLEGDSTVGAFAHFKIRNLDYQPVATFGNNNVGSSLVYLQGNRTGGSGSYGHFLLDVNVDVDKPTGYTDHGLATWLNVRSMSGGRTNGFWPGANSPASNIAGHAWDSPFGVVSGAELNFGNRWADLGIQTSLTTNRATIGMMVVPDVLPSKDGLNYWTVASVDTGTDVVTVTGHNFTDWIGIEFYAAATGGTLPTGITEGTAYYVRDVSTDTFKVASTLGGAAIDLTDAMAGTVRCVPRYPGTFGYILSKSVHNNLVGTGFIIQPGTIQPNGHGFYLWGSPSTTGRPATGMVWRDNWTTGINFNLATFAGGQAIAMNATTHKINWGAVASVGAPSSGTGLDISALTASDKVNIKTLSGVSIQAADSGTQTQLGFFGATPVIQRYATGTTTGFTAGTGTAVNDASTFTGGVGSRQYRINDIVKALKELGFLLS